MKNTFVKNQKVVVNVEGEFLEGVVKSILKNGMISVEFDDGEIGKFPPSEVVDYSIYKSKIKKSKTEEKSKTEYKSKKLTKKSDELEEEEEELNWGDLEDEIEEDEDDELADLDDELDHDLNDPDDEYEKDYDNDEDELDENLEFEEDEEEDDDEDIAFEKGKQNKKTSEDIGDDWFGIGDDDDEKFMSLPSTTKRFWLSRGNKTVITIITEKPITYREHRVRINGRTHHLTCLATSGLRCPLCEIGNPASPKKAFYVIDHTEYFSKSKNKTIKHSLAIWALGTRQYAILKAAAEKYFKNEENISYRGLRIEVRRSNDRLAPNCGDVFFIEGVVNKDIFKGDYDKSLKDLIKELKPLDEKMLRTRLPMIENETYDEE